MNTLPKSFGVLNDGSQLFKDIVLPYLREFHSQDLKGDSIGELYGVETTSRGGIVDGNKVTILSVEQFIEMTKEKQIVYGVYSGANWEGGCTSKELYKDIKDALRHLNRLLSNEKIEAKARGQKNSFKQKTDSKLLHHWSDGYDYYYIQEFELI